MDIDISIRYSLQVEVTALHIGPCGMCCHPCRSITCVVLVLAWFVSYFSFFLRVSFYCCAKLDNLNDSTWEIFQKLLYKPIKVYNFSSEASLVNQILQSIKSNVSYYLWFYPFRPFQVTLFYKNKLYKNNEA